MNETSSEYDIVLWGATGFTGQLVAEYLTERYEESDLDLAIAGRNKGKLSSLKQDLFEKNDGWSSLPILIGDAFNRDSLDPIVETTRTVCSTVGPYAVYGSDLVEACVDHGTNYCDLTGEVQWIRRMIDEHHETARSKGARIVHSCGFDSIPSDIGTLMVQEYARDQFDSYCDEVKSFVSSDSLSLSGGTMASMVKIFEDASTDPRVRRILQDPYALNPAGERDGPDSDMQQGPSYDSDLGKWTAPFIMALTNEKIVRRSNALLEYSWGENFRFSETMPAGSGITGSLKATAISAGFWTANATMALSPLRNFLDRFVLPESGEGPSRETIENGSFDVRLIGNGTDPGSGNQFRIKGRVTANRDPGYGATARMLGESAVCLARGETETPLEGGILTPASGIGLPLIDRLEGTGVTFNVERDDSN